MKTQHIKGLAENVARFQNLFEKQLQLLHDYLSNVDPQADEQAYYKVICKIVKREPGYLIFSVSGNLFRIESHLAPFIKDCHFKTYKYVPSSGMFPNQKFTECLDLRIDSDQSGNLKANNVDWFEKLTLKYLDLVIWHLYPDAKEYYKNQW